MFFLNFSCLSTFVRWFSRVQSWSHLYFAEVQRPAGTWQLGTAESTGSGGGKRRLWFQKWTNSLSQLVDLKQSQSMEGVCRWERNHIKECMKKSKTQTHVHQNHLARARRLSKRGGDIKNPEWHAVGSCSQNIVKAEWQDPPFMVSQPFGPFFFEGSKIPIRGKPVDREPHV